MAYSHCMGTGLGHVQRTRPGAVGSNMLNSDVHTGLRQGKEPGSIVTCTCPVPMQCESAIIVLLLADLDGVIFHP